MSKKIRTWMMPISMGMGTLFYNQLYPISFLSAYAIFMILFFTYCRLSLSEFKFSKIHFILLGVQLLLTALIYALIAPFNPIVAQGVMICAFVATAMSAPVVTGMLGGSVAFVAAYALLSNTMVAVLAPFLFSFIGHTGAYISFMESAIHICSKVGPMLIVPFVLALFVERFLPKVNDEIKKYPAISFYLWNIGLLLVTSKTVYFLVNESSGNYGVEALLALGALVVCFLQFAIGKKLGEKYGDRISVGQALGQKNTILAIWMAQAYLHPVASIGPAAYVLWQNAVNTYQMWKFERKKISD